MFGLLLIILSWKFCNVCDFKSLEQIRVIVHSPENYFKTLCIFTIIFFLTLWGNWNYIGVGQSNFCLVWVFLRTCLVYPQPLLSVRFLLVVYSFPSVSSFHQIIFEKKAYKFVNLISIFSNVGKNIFAKYWAVSKKQHKWGKVSLDIVSSSFICYISQLNLEKNV